MRNFSILQKAQDHIHVDNDFFELSYLNTDLDFYFAEGKVHKISGPITIHAEGRVYGKFNCTILLDSTYPNCFPKVFENGNSILKTASRHVNGDGTFCLCVTPIALKESKKGISIARFYKEYLIPYLASQIYFNKWKIWPGGEYLHGLSGVVQFFKENFGTDSDGEMVKIINFYTKNTMNILRVKCYCGKKTLFADCCGSKTQVLEDLPKDYLISFLKAVAVKRYD